MDAQAFWDVIGKYNQNTIIIQAVLLVLIVSSTVLSYTGKASFAAKLTLGITNLFIGFVFFGYYGTEPIQKFFALPLYLGCGVLFVFEALKNKKDRLNKPKPFQTVMLGLYAAYPLVSCLLGNGFPKMVTHIMPCPVVSLSIILYAGYRRKNKLLLALLTIWGLTGVKSVIFRAYEDIILLICGIYGVYLLVKEIKCKKPEKQ